MTSSDNRPPRKNGAARPDEGLGPNSDIGSRLRALYGAVQDEGVPSQLLDLLEKLDTVERAQTRSTSENGETA